MYLKSEFLLILVTGGCMLKSLFILEAILRSLIMTCLYSSTAVDNIDGFEPLKK